MKVLADIDLNGHDLLNRGNDPAGGGAVVSTTVAQGVASTGQNIHNGTLYLPTSVNWDLSINNATYLNSFSNGDSAFQLAAGQYNIHAAVGIINTGLNNRNTYALYLRHTDSADADIFAYALDSCYVRDDANDYDSAVMATDKRIIVADDDKVLVQVVTLDRQTVTGTVQPDVNFTQVKIDRIS